MSSSPSKKKAEPKAAGRPRAEEVEARTEDLKRTAGRLMLQKGYANVSLEMIAREAHVAVRTIYIKFGGKIGILRALMQDKRDAIFDSIDLERDPRPIREVLDDFATRLYSLLTSPEAVGLQRMLAAEARANPELVDTFFAMGPDVSRGAIAQFLQRPEVRAQLRDDLPFAQLPVLLINTVLGDQLSRVLRDRQEGTPEECALALRQRMEMFYRSVLR
ncbi:TetR/AcrR family transcriptional regulator [Aquabacterium soli]|jgi:TetR/AcrR family transcriptional regulator, mexJK operon transcriptional repressor|uniref:TetR/AcrR family transcriptional regulator n=1 Tax=Aquabacterium soli TaxID=2493092 RepID=A0A426VCZ5_9BURK|nr:TetR/AcrR family transcriptional regulator [Aquabacterium soli]RRS04737.1 TetR/AcrR family transcriptional regulator [Aquabacterium soli]